MKLFFHVYYTPLLIFNIGMWTCNPFQGGFGFFKSCICNTYYSFLGNSKLFMNKYLINENLLTTYSPLNLSQPQPWDEKVQAKNATRESHFHYRECEGVCEGIITKCGCSSLVLVHYTNEFIVSSVIPVHYNQ